MKPYLLSINLAAPDPSLCARGAGRIGTTSDNVRGEFVPWWQPRVRKSLCPSPPPPPGPGAREPSGEGAKVAELHASYTQ